jgi:hypothetical protein
MKVEPVGATHAGRQEEGDEEGSCGPGRGPERSFGLECLHSVCRAHQIVVFRIIDMPRDARPEGLEPPTLGLEVQIPISL